jgi:serine/threonine-protein phosphatase 6 regulatory ankyrin repeat subunit B
MKKRALVYLFIIIVGKGQGQSLLLKAIEKNDTTTFDKILSEKINVNRVTTSIHTKYSISRKRRIRSGKVIIDKRFRKDIPLIYFNKTQLALSKATLVNNYYFVSKLLDKGAKPNKRNINTVLTPQGWAAHNGNLEMVKLLLERGAKINSSYKNWRTSPLMEAIEWRHWDVAKYLIEKGADINIEDKKGKTALHHAAIQKNFEVTKILADKGADVNHIDNDGISVLEDACIDGVLFAEEKTNFEIIKYLIGHGAKTNNKAINNVVRKGEVEIAKYLINKGAPVSGELVLNASNGLNFDLFRFLVDTLGLKKNIYDSSGFLENGILQRVCSGFWTNGADRTLNLSMLQYVLDMGANLYQVDDKGQTVFAILVEYGKPDSTTFAGATLLISKCNKDDLKRYRILDYPLKKAAYQGLAQTCRLFIDNGADVNHFGEDKGTILHQACWHNNNEEVIRLLVEHGANINAKDNRGNTPAMGCGIQGRNENIKTLIDLGSDPNIKNIAGLTLLDMISDENLIVILKGKGAKSGKDIK